MKPLRLQKFMADAGLMSRRAAEEEIRLGRVAVNGHPAEIGTVIDPHKDLVTYRGKRIQLTRREHVYILLNKPRGYLCSTSDEHGRKCVTDLLEGVEERIYPVGRLDMLSEGALLLTDDGALKQRLTHPSTSPEKVYRVKVAEAVSEEVRAALEAPMTIDGYRLRPVEVTLGEQDESGSVLKFTLHEGRNRQIRKMCEAVGLHVKRLSRISIGRIKLDGLPVGKWRYLDEEEISYLKRSTERREPSVKEAHHV